MEIPKAFDSLLGRDDAYVPDVSVEGDSLVIDCRGCGYAPDPSSRECIACMVASMCRAGSAERVVLRTGRDTEVSGRAGRVLKDVASLRRWSIPVDAPPMRCRGCAASRKAVMEEAWASFPDPGTGGVGSPEIEPPERDGCAECAAATMRALEQLNEGLDEVKASMAEAYRVARWTSTRSWAG